MAWFTLLILTFLLFRKIHGSDPFEDMLSVRLECYGTEQSGCSTDFIDAHPNLAMSYNNLTRADTHFYLFTNTNPEVPELLHKCPEAVPPKTLFNPNFRTDIVIPGFVSGICNFAAFREIKNEMLKKGNYNMLLVDWMWGNFFDLEDTFYNAKIVAKQIAVVVNILKKKFNLTHKDFSCTGHSYGAHVCGYVGQETHIAIINALEANGVVFTKNTPLDDRLDPGDADCVQAIHTNDGQCLPALGTNFTLGTVDIYFNGGKFQKASFFDTRNAFFKGDFIFGFDSIFTGNHMQALHYYKATINAKECKFIAVKCRNYRNFKQDRCASCGENGQNCILVGPDCCDCLSSRFLERKRIRRYYLDTDDHCPYCNNSKVDISGFHCNKPSAGA